MSAQFVEELGPTQVKKSANSWHNSKYTLTEASDSQGHSLTDGLWATTASESADPKSSSELVEKIEDDEVVRAAACLLSICAGDSSTVQIPKDASGAEILISTQCSSSQRARFRPLLPKPTRHRSPEPSLPSVISELPRLPGRREWSARSRDICKSCRKKHSRCDKARPCEEACTRSGLQCDVPST